MCANFEEKLSFLSLHAARKVDCTLCKYIEVDYRIMAKEIRNFIILGSQRLCKDRISMDPDDITETTLFALIHFLALVFKYFF